MKSSTLLHKNTQYLALQYQMIQYQAAYLNNEQFRRLVRAKRPSEDAAIYRDLILHTAAMPIARYVVDTINDTVFEPGVKREVQFANPAGGILNPDTQEWSELFMLDADLNNTNLNGVMEQIGELTSIYGHCWVFVDMPYNDGTPDPRLRPYVCPVAPTNVWDWSLTNVRGVWIPEYVKILERETAECYYIKCYYLGTTTTPSRWESYEVEKRDHEVERDLQPQARGTFPLGMSIPGFIAYTRRDPRSIDMGISDIDVATDIQKEHYKLECEAYQATQFARTIIRADNGIKVPAHAGSIVRATQGQIEAIDINTQDVNTITAKQESLLQGFENLTGIGGIKNSSSQIQSGISIIQERRRLHKLAKAKARLMEVAEEMIWTYAARYMGVRWAGEVNFNTDYEQTDTQYRLALFNQAKSLVPENPIINGMILRELVGMIAPPHEVAQYQVAVDQFTDPAYQILQREEAIETYTRDVEDQVPEPQPGEEGSREEMIEHADESNVGTLNPGIVYTGQSYYTTDAVASQLGLGIGGGR